MDSKRGYLKRVRSRNELLSTSTFFVLRVNPPNFNTISTSATTMLGAFSDKPRLDRTSLENQGVFYLEEIIFSSSDCAVFAELDKRSQCVLERVRTYLGPSCPDWDYAKCSWRIPSNVDSLRESLLDSTCLIPKSATEFLLEDHERDRIPEHAVFHDNLKLLSNYDREEQLEVFRRIFNTCREIRRIARENQRDRVSEGEWQHFMEHYIFKRYRDGAKSIFDRYESDSKKVE